MREIKFRGFDEENNCWRYGWYTRLVEGARAFDAIICFEDDGVLTRYYIHDDSTIGQFTGLHDKNGVEIYEGDILEVNFNDDCCNIGKQKAIIKYSDKHASFLVEPLNDWSFCGMDEGTVIGNIHEEEQPCTSATVE